MRIFLIVFIFLSTFIYGQIEETKKPTLRKTPGGIDLPNDTVGLGKDRKRPGDSLKVFIPTIKDYLYWKEGQQKFEEIDTTLTIESFYNQNFLQKDIFGNMPFPNIGQTLNPLEYREQNSNRLQFIPTGKSFNYVTIDDIRYFDVKTPITEFIYENGVKEGQALSTLFSHSPNAQVNYSIQYKGLRSLGRFQEQLAVNNAFIAGIRYKTKNERFKLWMHYASQNFDNEENAGIQTIEDFTDSQVAGGLESLAVRLTDVRTEFDSRRFHQGMSYGLLKKVNPEDSTTYHPIFLKNKFTYEKQKFFYEDDGTAIDANDLVYNSPTIANTARNNLRSFESTQNTTTASFNWGEKLYVETGVRFENIQLYADSALVSGLINIPARVEDNLFSLVGKFNFDWNEKLKLTGNAEVTQGDFFGNTYNVFANLDVQPINGYKISGGALVQSVYPSLNLLFNQSFYENFNYFNTSFSNQDTQKLFGKISSDKYRTSIEGSFYNIDNYTFTDASNRPRQLNSTMNLYKIRVNHHSQYKNFHLNTNLQYQQVLDGDLALPLPDFFGRLTVYYQNAAFKRAANVQVGFNLNYFSTFQSREFFAVTNEFALPSENDQEIGGFPLLDFFFNMKVKRMRIYLRADHLFGLAGERNYFSTPNIPYRNFKIQFGIKWYLFT